MRRLLTTVTILGLFGGVLGCHAPTPICDCSAITPPTTGTPTQMPPVGTIPQVEPKAGTIPQVEPKAGTIPQVEPKAGATPQVDPNAKPEPLPNIPKEKEKDRLAPPIARAQT